MLLDWDPDLHLRMFCKFPGAHCTILTHVYQAVYIHQGHPALPPLSTLIITIILHIEYCPFMLLLLASFHLQYRLLYPKDRQLLRYKLNGVRKRWRTEDIMHITISTVLGAVISVVPAASSSLTADGRSIDTKWSFPS